MSINIGNYKHFRSFVRRRRWIRLRQRPIIKSSSNEQTSNAKTQTLVDIEQDNTVNNNNVSHQEIMIKLKQCRLDRERLTILDNAAKSTLPGLEDQLLEKVKKKSNTS